MKRQRRVTAAYFSLPQPHDQTSTDERSGRPPDCAAVGPLAICRAMSASTPLQMLPEDKLDVLRYLDEFHYWHSLDDEQICKRCYQTITGRQILVIELQGTRGKLHLKCPTAGCAATPGDWTYANPVQAARLRAGAPASFGQADAVTVVSQRTHHGDATPKRKLVVSPKRASIFAPAPSFRAALARLVLVRPIATALHAFRPIS